MNDMILLHPSAVSTLRIITDDLTCKSLISPNPKASSMLEDLIGIYPQFAANWVALYPSDRTKAAPLIQAIAKWTPASDFPLWTLLYALQMTLVNLNENVTLPTKIGNAYKVKIPNTQFPDVTLRAGDKTIPCHKVFLSTHSDFFQALFHSQMSESQQNEITINEIEFALLEKVVLFCYGEIQIESAAELLDLLVCADKYQMKALEEDCLHLLSRWKFETEDGAELWKPFLANFNWKPTGNGHMLRFLLHNWRIFLWFPGDTKLISNHLSHFKELLPSV